MKNWVPPVGYVEKKYNYTYKLVYKNDNRYYYYGVHSTNILPEIDGYYGSGGNIKKMKKLYGKDCFEKTILKMFPTRKEALLEEDALVTSEMLTDKFCLNIIHGGGTFDTTGLHLTEEQKKEISKRFKGKKRTKESIEKMLETKKKHDTFKTSEETKKKLSEINKNKLNVYKGNIQKRINKEELEKYINDGWIRGYTKERNLKVSKSKIGEKNPNFGKKWTKESIEKMLETKKKNNTLSHSEETKKKLAEINRKNATNPDIRKKLSIANKGKNTWSRGLKRIYKGSEKKMVKQEELEHYLSNGWLMGFGPKIEKF